MNEFYSISFHNYFLFEKSLPFNPISQFSMSPKKKYISFVLSSHISYFIQTYIITSNMIQKRFSIKSNTLTMGWKNKKMKGIKLKKKGIIK